ncbi:MAG: septum formation initiator family protein [Flavobacteriales bacterium]
MKFLTILKSKTPKFIQNKWALSFLVLFIWVLFFEDINLISLFRTKSKINKLKQEWVFKEERIKQAEEKKSLILSNPEKYARETFWMKRENEEIFIISTKDK